MEMQVNGCGVLQYFHKCVQVLAGNSGGKVGRNFDSRRSIGVVLIEKGKVGTCANKSCIGSSK